MRTRAAALSAALLLACSDATGPRDPVGSVFMPASVSITGAFVLISNRPAIFWIEVANTSAATATVGYGVCAFAVEGYTGPSRGGKPAWAEVLPQLGGGCGPDILYSFDVPGNASVPYSGVGPIDGALIDKGPHLKLLYRRSGESFTRSMPVTWIEVD
jgi:hypothetical protein